MQGINQRRCSRSRRKLRALDGLGSPAKIVTDELDAVKLMFWSHENRIANMLKRHNSQLMLEDGNVSGNESENDDMLPVIQSPTPGPSRPNWSWTRRSAIEVDSRDMDDDKEMDFGDEYAFDDNGYVV